jgi:hypothetical protein
MPPDPAAAGWGLGQRLPTVPAVLRDDNYHLIHLLDRQQRAEGPTVSGLAAAFSS